MRHLCFNPSGAATLRRVLASVNRQATVLTSFDDLSVGPVLDVCGAERRRWAQDYYASEGFDAFWLAQASFWNGIAEQGKGDLTVWINRRSALELAGFMELLWRLPDDAAFRLGDCTDKVSIMPMETREPYVLTSTGTINIKQWLGLLESTVIASKHNLRTDVHTWGRLRQENAPLRTFVGDHMMSVPADHYDGDILTSIWPTWRRTLRVLAECLALLPGQKDHSQVSDIWILHRIEAMADAGLVEFRDQPGMPAFEIRLRDAAR